MFNKIIILGDPDVGKRSLYFRFRDQKFYDGQEYPSAGTGFKHREFNDTINADGTIKLCLWYPQPQHQHQIQAKIYMQEAAAIILMYDVSRMATFESMQKYYTQLSEDGMIQDEAIVLLGNKIDQEDSREVTNKQAEEYALNINAFNFECSTKTDEGVDMLFELMAGKLYL